MGDRIAGGRIANGIRWRLIGLAALATLPGIAPDSESAEPLLSVHGSGDAFATTGAALAWAVQRGASEATTDIVIRVETDPARYPMIAASGVDPFTQARHRALAPTPSAGSFDVRLPRSRFAEFPRTELEFYADAGAAGSSRPALVVYYVGVPDTTPEFADAAKLDAYLTARLAKARADAKVGRP